MKYNKNIINDIIGWDTSVWGQSLKFFDENVDFRNVKIALELGSGSNGGYSLYFASKDIDTICSNPFGDFESAKKVHSKYDFSTKIIYEKIDALDIPYENKFDCISFKSIMGVLGNREERFKNINAQKKMISNVSKSLKKGGYLIFAENLKGSKFHQYILNKYGWGKNYKGWRYFSITDYFDIVGGDFTLLNYKTTGVLGNMVSKKEIRFKESLKRIFGKIDTFILDKLLKENSRYVIFAVFKKNK